MTTEYVVYINKSAPTAPFAMRQRTWATLVQMYKDRYGESWEGHLKVVAQGLSEDHAEGLVKLMRAGGA